MTSILDQDIMYLPGVGPKRKEILSKELNIQTWRDLLEYYPYKYVDRSKIYTIDELNGSIPFVQIKGKILSFEEFSNGTRRKRIVAHFSDGHGVVDLVWFRGTQYIYKTYALNTEYIVFGKPTVFGSRYQFAHPEIEKADELQLNEMGMQPYYSTTERMKTNGITSRTIEKLTKNLISRLPKDAISETLPVFIQRPLHLISREAAFIGIHYPKSLDELQPHK
jgi:ATP-dependent DNA helicase recG